MGLDRTKFSTYMQKRRPHVFNRGEGIEYNSDLFARETKPVIREIETLEELRTNLKVEPATGTTPIYIPTKQVMLDYLKNKGGPPSFTAVFNGSGDCRSQLVGGFRLHKLLSKMRQLLRILSTERGTTWEYRARCVEELAKLSSIIDDLACDANTAELDFFCELDSPFREDFLCQDLRAVASAWRAYETEGPRVCTS
ncbi:hypothetical protein S40288_11399 [Stachybotrys chartarum IBT 40288]|nr:hypothetical protein S40288_11399 [Stachybotrys chartarum IBT 40288]